MAIKETLILEEIVHKINPSNDLENWKKVKTIEDDFENFIQDIARSIIRGGVAGAVGGYLLNTLTGANNPIVSYAIFGSAIDVVQYVSRGIYHINKKYPQ